MRREIQRRDEAETKKVLEKAFGSYESYLLYVHRGRWKTAPHLKKICKALERIERGESTRLILSLPPRHGKSMSVTESFPSWFMGRHPERRVIEVSYGDSLARKFGRANRRKIEEFGHQIFGVALDHGNKSVTNWGLEGYSGGMISVGIDGAITGEGADLMIIDDPVKNRREAQSEVMREFVWDEWQNSILTRLHPGGSVIVIMTRWHEDDIVGRLLAEEGSEWEIINFPCAAEEKDPLGRAVGEPLWPDRGFDAKWMQRKKRSVGTQVWDSLYQGHPRPQEGGLFKAKFFRRYKTSDDGQFFRLITPSGEKLVERGACRIYQACDVAGSMKTSADYFVLGTFALAPDNDLIVLDILRTRLEGPDQPALMRMQFYQWRPLMVGVESKNMGLTLYQQLAKDGLPIVELKADTDKYTRAIPAATRYEAGTIYHPDHAPWLDAFESELLAFPNGAHDDQVDVTAYASLMQIWGYLQASNSAQDSAMVYG